MIANIQMIIVDSGWHHPSPPDDTAKNKRSFLPILKPSMRASNVCRKISAETFPPKLCKALNGRLPPEDGSVRPQTLGKRVADDPRHFIFRRPLFFFHNFLKFFSGRRIGKLLGLKSYGFLDAIGRCASKNDLRSFDVQLSMTFGRGVKVVHNIRFFGHDIDQKWLSQFWSYLEDTCNLARRHMCPG